MKANNYVLAQRAAGRFCKNPTAANRKAMENSITRYSNDALKKGKTIMDIDRIASKLRSCSAIGATVGKTKKRVGTTTAATAATTAVGKTRKTRKTTAKKRY